MQGGTQAILRASAVESRVSEFLHQWLPEHLLGRLLEMTQNVAKTVLAGSRAPKARFPRPPGSHLPEADLGTPALAFVRTMCHILALDTSVADEVRHSRAAPARTASRAPRLAPRLLPPACNAVCGCALGGHEIHKVWRNSTCRAPALQRPVESVRDCAGGRHAAAAAGNAARARVCARGAI
jgi:hypothetical protein